MSTTTTAPKPIRVRAPNGCLKYEGFVLDPQALRRYLIRSTQVSYLSPLLCSDVVL